MKSFLASFFSLFILSGSMLAECPLYNLVGTAQYVEDAQGNTCVQLTDEMESEKGCAWRTDMFDFSQPIDEEMTMNFGVNDGNGADGICMVFQADSAGLNACGVSGGEIGAGGIDNSFIIEVDIWENPELGDPIQDHIAVNVNGDMGMPINGPVVLPNIEDGMDHTLRFVWDPSNTTYQIYFDGNILLVGTYDIIMECLNGSPICYYGFTASTGGFSNVQRICPSLPIVTDTLNVEICDGDFIMINNITYINPGQYEQELQTMSGGCDSVLVINVSVVETLRGEIEVSFCSGDSVVVNGIPYPFPGVYLDTLESVSGCDSILRITVTEMALNFLSETYEIVPGDTIFRNGIAYGDDGTFVQILPASVGCDTVLTLIIIQNIVEQTILHYNFENCLATSKGSNMDYGEFTAEQPSPLSCGTVDASTIYRENPMENKHSCTFGAQGIAMCVGADDECYFDFQSDRTVKFDVTITPENNVPVQLSKLSFYQKAPQLFQWLNGPQGLNNYPQLFGLIVTKNNGDIILIEEDLQTTLDWTLEEFNFSQDSAFRIDAPTTFTFELMGYCPVGVSTDVSVWDLDEVQLSAICVGMPPDQLNIGGTIQTQNGDPFEEVDIRLQKLVLNADMQTVATDSDGQYMFEKLESGPSYRISPYNNKQVSEGVSTLDLVRIQKHLLNILPFDNPYDMIAADANNSRTISALDLIELRKVILGTTTEFTNNTSWRFGRLDMEPTMSSPWFLRSTKTIQTLREDHLGEHFVAIKIGDVNGTLNSRFKDREITNRSDNSYGIQIKNDKSTDPNYQKINFIASENINLTGLQMSFDIGALMITNLVPGKADIHDSNWVLNDNRIVNLSWISPTFGTKIQAGEILFSFLVEKSQDTKHHIRLNHESLQSEIYLDAGAVIRAITLEPVERFGVHQNELYQNSPNPFSQKTQIGFNLREAGQIEFNIYNSSGASVYQLIREYPAGVHSISVSENQLKEAKGLLFYQLKTATGIETLKMIRAK